MGIVKSGIAQGFSGKVGNMVFSQHEDRETTVSLAPAPSTKAPTTDQLSTRQDTSVCTAFVRPLAEFAKIGFRLQGKLERQTGYNAMLSYVRKNALTGIYPNRIVDVSGVLMTRGNMRPPEDAAVQLTGSGLAFSWNPEIKVEGLHFSDQVVMMAYFPELKMARYMIGGAQRHAGKDVLMLTGIKQGYAAAVYLSFITDNREAISDSVYLGQFIW
ncbi:DUF6266 family protein [Pedobacter hartonius]|uniref:Uncharacterized protein n=1 Tax=Pedobacter hartonius TaxID=425514 RepID=A0A1H3WQD4_9SPHI|nr:DUF6266 family protein [Pedobacter hartonius]SDZ89345.1 hypothetical protein SAMN05443550_101353 [Pedobacter hartonius]